MSAVKSGPPDQIAFGPGAFFIWCPGPVLSLNSGGIANGQERTGVRQTSIVGDSRLGCLSGSHQNLVEGDESCRPGSKVGGL